MEPGRLAATFWKHGKGSKERESPFHTLKVSFKARQEWGNPHGLDILIPSWVLLQVPQSLIAPYSALFKMCIINWKDKARIAKKSLNCQLQSNGDMRPHLYSARKSSGINWKCLPWAKEKVVVTSLLCFPILVRIPEANVYPTVMSYSISPLTIGR